MVDINPVHILILQVEYIILIILDTFLLAIGIYKRKKGYGKLFLVAGILVLFVILYAIFCPPSPVPYNL